MDDDFPGDIDDRRQAPATKRDLIEGNIDKVMDRDLSREVAVSGQRRTLAFGNMLDMMQFSKLMATGGQAIPPFLRGNPGACLAITMQANEWEMSPFQVANKAYVTNDRIGYESQLIHAVIEARSPLKERLRRRYIGSIEDGTRQCIVTGTLRGETEPREYTTPPLAKIIAGRGRNDRGQVKGSPLWDTDPDLQLWYYGSRSWARAEVPDVLMGIYAVDELPDEQPDPTLTVGVNGLQARLAARPAEAREEGFAADGPDDTIETALAAAGHVQAAKVDAAPAQVDHAPAAEQAQPDGDKPKRTRKPKAETAPPPAEKPAETPNAEPREAPDAFSEEEEAQTTQPQQAGPDPAPEPPPVEQYAALAEESLKLTTAEAYVDYAKAWMPAAPTPEHRGARWKAEKAARERLGVMGDPLAELIVLGKTLKEQAAKG